MSTRCWNCSHSNYKGKLVYACTHIKGRADNIHDFILTHMRPDWCPIETGAEEKSLRKELDELKERVRRLEER